MEERIAASSYECLLAALRADPEAGNLRFPVTPPLQKERPSGDRFKPGSGLPCSRAERGSLTPVFRRSVGRGQQAH